MPVHEVQEYLQEEFNEHQGGVAMSTDDERAVRRRAASIPAHLRVRAKVKGSAHVDPKWLVYWRPSKGNPKELTVGRAWLTQRNPFVVDAEKRAAGDLARTTGWERMWTPRKVRNGELRDGALTPTQARVRAMEMVHLHELEIEHAEELAEAKRRAEANAGVLFEDVADDYVAERIEIDGLKPKSAQGLRSMLTRKGTPPRKRGKQPKARIMQAFEGQPIADITAEDCRLFMRSLDRDNDIAPRSVNAHRQVLKGVFGFAVERGLIDDDPMAGERKRREPDKPELIVLDPAQIMAVARVLEEGRHRNPHVYAVGPRKKGRRVKTRALSRQEQETQRWRDLSDAVAVQVAGFAGLRVGEIAALRWRHIGWDEGLLHIERNWSGGEEVSTKGRLRRSVELAPQLSRELARLGQRPQQTGAKDLVFPGADGADGQPRHLDGSSLGKRYRKALSVVQEDDPDTPDVSLHKLRSSFISMALDAYPLVDVAGMAGHKHITTTSGYAHRRRSTIPAGQRMGALIEAETGATAANADGAIAAG